MLACGAVELLGVGIEDGGFVTPDDTLGLGCGKEGWRDGVME